MYLYPVNSNTKDVTVEIVGILLANAPHFSTAIQR